MDKLQMTPKIWFFIGNTYKNELKWSNSCTKYKTINEKHITSIKLFKLSPTVQGQNSDNILNLHIGCPVSASNGLTQISRNSCHFHWNQDPKFSYAQSYETFASPGIQVRPIHTLLLQKLAKPNNWAVPIGKALITSIWGVMGLNLKEWTNG